MQLPTRRQLTLLLVLLASSFSFSQSQATVTGNVSSITGVTATSGIIQFTLAPFSTAIQYRVNGVTILDPIISTCGIDSSGNIKNSAGTGACLVWGNDNITPANTCYQVGFNPNGAGYDRVLQGVQITGASVDLASPTFCPSVRITPEQVSVSTDALSGNIVPSADNFFVVGGPQNRYNHGYFTNIDMVGGTFTITGGSCVGCGVGTVTSVATTSPITGGPFSTTGTIAINNAAADGSTKGAASFTAADFDASTGNISIDYTNGQAADGTHKGFLTSGDWTTFNAKQATIAGNTLAANNFATSINAAGTISGAQPSAANLSNGTTGSGSVVLAASPGLTGSPTAPTQTFTDSSTKIATTAFVQNFAPGGAGAAVSWFSPGFTSGSVSVVSTNVVRLAHFSLLATVSFNTIGVTNSAADAAGLYSFGVYSLDGTVLYAHTTAQGMTGSNTFRALAVSEGTVTLAQGDYLFAWTGNAVTATFNTMNTFPSRLIPTNSSTVTASGVMPAAPINVPALSPVQAAANIISFILYK